MKYIITNTQVLQVISNTDGSLFITADGINSIQNAGAFIVNMGGIDAVNARCIESELSLANFRAKHEAEVKAYKAARHEAGMAILKKASASYKDEYMALVAQGMLDVTEDNVATVLRYFNTMNLGSWPELPKFNIGYTINQYQTDGNISTAIKFNDGQKFCVGYSHNAQLKSYTQLR